MSAPQQTLRRPRLRRLRVPFLAAAVTALVGAALVLPGRWAATDTASAASTFSFGVAGDFGQTDSSTGAVLNAVRSSGTDMMFAIGDFSYIAGNSEQGWCDYVHSRVGASYPFELLAGNHESYPRDGYYPNYDACLPDRLGVTGSYGQEYYVDYPANAPLVRFVMISPNLPYGSSSATPWSYKSTSPHYAWTKTVLDDAKAKGLWTVVGMHEYCTSLVNQPCVVGTDIMNLILREKVDLLFQAHDHAFARSKQLALGGSCASFAPTSYNPDCVANPSATTYTKGVGTVVTTVGTGGKNMNKENDPVLPQAPYFASYQGSNSNATWGFVRVAVSPSQLSASFVRGSGGSFTDSYTITNSSPVTPSPTSTTPSPTSTTPSPTSTTPPPTSTTPPPTSTTPPPGGTTTLPPVADTWVGSDAATTAHGSDTSLYSVTGTPTKVTYLKFDLSGVTGTLTGASLKVQTTTSSSSGSPSIQNVYAVADSGWSESTMTYGTAPALGAKAGSLPGGSTSNTPYTVPLTPSALQSAVGGQLTLAIKGAAADTFYVNSKEASTGKPQLVLTTG